MFNVDDKVIICLARHHTCDNDYNGFIGTIIGVGESMIFRDKMWYYVAFDRTPPLSDMPPLIFSKEVISDLLVANYEVTSNTDLYGKFFYWFKESQLVNV